MTKVRTEGERERERDDDDDDDDDDDGGGDEYVYCNNLLLVSFYTLDLKIR